MVLNGVIQMLEQNISSQSASKTEDHQNNVVDTENAFTSQSQNDNASVSCEQYTNGET